MKSLAQARSFRNRQLRAAAEQIVTGALEAPGMPEARIIPVEWLEDLKRALGGQAVDEPVRVAG
ncbi:MAG: hypothetical protein U0556_17760 [Dehalococcoidia bacterium]